MGTLEDQLKKWKQEAKPAASSSSSPSRKAPTKKEPFPKQVLRKEPSASSSSRLPVPPARVVKSDAELFAAAVAAVDADVVLEKFSPAPGPSRTSAASPPPTDEELFAQFIAARR